METRLPFFISIELGIACCTIRITVLQKRNDISRVLSSRAFQPIANNEQENADPDALFDGGAIHTTIPSGAASRRFVPAYCSTFFP